jgi:hypothetical protein
MLQLWCKPFAEVVIADSALAAGYAVMIFSGKRRTVGSWVSSNTHALCRLRPGIAGTKTYTAPEFTEGKAATPAPRMLAWTSGCRIPAQRTAY